MFTANRMMYPTVAALLVLASGAAADVLQVPATYPTIQAAIDVAAAGDTIEVGPGTYRESVDWTGKDLTIVGAGAGLSIIDAGLERGGPGGACVIATELTSASRLEGFTLTGGSTLRYYSSDDDMWVVTRLGSGITAINTTMTIASCTMSGNECQGGYRLDYSSVWSGGDGIRAIGGAPTVIGCTIDDNMGSGVASVLNDGSAATFVDCGFTRPPWAHMLNTNTPAAGVSLVRCTMVGGGGGIQHTGGSLNMTNCTLRGLQTQFGRGIWFSGTDLVATGCLFADNHNTLTDISRLADVSGVVIRMFGGRGTVTNCTFANNSGGLWGAAILASDCVVSNSIFMENRSISGGLSHMAGAVTASWCNVQGGYAGVGNIDADPLFVNALSGDYAIDSSSPCIDAGNNTLVAPTLLTDINGQPRFVDVLSVTDTGVGAAPVVDIGAFEVQGGRCPADYNNDGAVDGDDVIAFFEDWDNGYFSADFNRDESVDGDDVIEFFGHWDAGC
ncbi:MAG: right-handed parallel beta-helix repeat-containing protein [Phycisphaerales bacterium]